MHLDFVGYLPDDILVKLDRASMAASLEARCPLLDYRVAEFAWRLPRDLRVDAKGGKRILRDVLARYVPPALTERPKQGFSVPIAGWLRGPLKAWAEDYLAEERLRRQGLFEPAQVRLMWEQHRSGWRKHTKLIWAMLVFQTWADEYL
jgi:asparagine synthase (glutamine-hydrolysing)